MWLVRFFMAASSFETLSLAVNCALIPLLQMVMVCHRGTTVVTLYAPAVLPK